MASGWALHQLHAVDATRIFRTRKTHHSSASISPSCDVSSTFNAFSRRFGWSRNCKFGSPQLPRKLMTFLSDVTASTISVFVRLPLPSASMSAKTSRAAFRNCSLKASSSRRSAAAWASRAARRCSIFALSACSIAASLRCDRPVSREASTLLRPRRRRNSTPPARHHRSMHHRGTLRRVEGKPKFQTPKRTTREP